MKSKGHWQRVAAYPRDKGVPKEVMHHIKESKIYLWVDQKWQEETRKKNPSKSIVEGVIKKIHKRRRRQWDRLIERAALR
jgi:transposase